MPPRRLSRKTYSVTKFLIGVILIHYFLNFVNAQQQQQVQVQHYESQIDLKRESRIAQYDGAQSVDDRRKDLTLSKPYQNDASAIITLAPAESAVAAPTLRLSSSISAENTSPQIARSLRDWEVEDFVLLATIDGTLHACDRDTGEERWQLSHEQPMVQIKYYPRDYFAAKKESKSTFIDDYLWIVEPSRDGIIYVFRPNGSNPGLVNTGLTMKKLVEMTPYGNEDPPVIYTGEKKSSILTVDANTGNIVSWFGSLNSLATKETCKIDEGNLGRTEKCPKASMLILGRTEYSVSIFGRNDGHHIATIKYSEWSLNNYDQDLQHQYSQYASTIDYKYIYTGHDGSVVSYDYRKSTNSDDSGLLFQQNFSSPVVQVFDVARPWGSDKKSANLIILSQPQPPFDELEHSDPNFSSSIFLNHTEDGSWFAMSAKLYPLVVDGSKAAKYDQNSWFSSNFEWNLSNKYQLSEALVGLHSVENYQNQPGDEMLTIAGSEHDIILENLSHLNPYSSIIADDTAVLMRSRHLAQVAIQSSLELLKNPILVFLILTLVTYNQRYVRGRILNRFINEKNTKTILTEGTSSNAISWLNSLSKVSKYFIDNKVQQDSNSVNDSIKTQNSVPANSKLSIQGLDLIKPEISNNENSSVGIEGPKKKEKKTHRGRRGGVKHRKGAWANVRDTSVASASDSKGSAALNCLISNNSSKSSVPVQNMSYIQTVPCIPREITGSLVRIGALEVCTNKLIGTGSNGTMVFKGTFDGREVAVKRMLIQFFDIAFQETKLLRESDDHPNVVRYFSQQQADGFLYIALELYPASLADLIEKPHNHPELAQAGEKDLPNVLYQITNGLRHLHKLRIVHRDLKPQNILVSDGKDKKPRLVVSDFGLCKKLEGEESSFRATTAYAAGTSGWRAPELLRDDDGDDEKASQVAIIDASTDGTSSSAVLSSELLPSRRATRAIDIFSLGLIFFYVLTKGSHPFDCGDRFMREVNIRKGRYDLKSLEVLGDYTYEAKDLIGSMLSSNPKCRPLAYQVMAHPFFWSAKKRLNFLCDVSDHFEKETRDPPTPALQELESYALQICGNDFLKVLGREFVDSLGKQRKYTGNKLLDLLRALRNKKNHYEDMSEKLKKDVGPLPDGYLSFWTRKFPRLLIICWTVVFDLQWDESDRFRDYYEVDGG